MPLEEQLSRLDPIPAVESFVRDLCGTRNVETHHRANYLSIRPAPVGAIAVYAHAQHVSIAVAPDKAQVLRTSMPYAEHIEKTPATTYLIIRGAQMTEHHPALLDLAAESLDWRATGPNVSARQGNSAGTTNRKEVETCPNCWTEISPGGGCWCE